MNTKLISQPALDIIDQYRNFKIGNAVCSVPYFNNKTKGRRGGLRVEVGKGSPKDIFDEATQKAFEQRIPVDSLTSETLKKLLVDANIGIDCSGFAYYILNEESKSRGKGSLDKHLHFIHAKNILARFFVAFKPVKNIDVLTLADAKNSRAVSLKEIECGDMITMITAGDSAARNHILIINQIEYQNFMPVTIHYVHAMAWPTDGEYGHGIHEGKIEITDVNTGILEQRWIENDKTGDENYTFARGRKSLTELRRLAFL